MTQPNPGPAPAAPDQNQNPTPAAPATGPAPAPPAPPGFAPATGAGDTTAEDQAAQQLLAAAVQDDGNDGKGGKRQVLADLATERKARQELEQQIAKLSPLLVANKEMQKQLEALKPAADIFAQLRAAAVPDAEKTDTERLQEELAQLRETAETERMERFRVEVAAEKGLTREQAARLVGKTRDELVADADALLALFPKAPPAPAGEPPAAEPAPNGQQPAAQPAPAGNGPRPDPSQGARGPVDINAQIQEALAKGDVRTSIALKQRLRAQTTQ